MSVKTTLKLVGNVLLLTILFFFINMISGMLTQPLTAAFPALPEGSEGALLIGLLLTALVNASVVTAIVKSSRWHGWKLMLSAVFALYGVSSVLPTIEAVYFGSALGITPEMTPGLMIPNLLTMALSVPLAVLILRRWKALEAAQSVEKVSLTAVEWGIKLGVIAATYLILYFVFGLVIAWSNPALREMYGNGADQAMFGSGMIPLQILRSVLWVLFALPVIRTTKGKGWQVAVLIGILYALPMNIGLAIPNVFMPDPSVRLSHFIETSSSNFIFGLIVSWLVYRSHSSVRELFIHKHAKENVVAVAGSARGSGG